jgi:tRNA A37 threonylcarbamoyladenosine biosynthesis protein TsaE
MKREEFISHSKKETWEVAENLLNELDDNNLIVLKGELGSGKTTFAQGILKSLEAKGPFTSPTFVVMKAYSVGKKQETRNKEQTPQRRFVPAGQANSKFQIFSFAKAMEDRQNHKNPLSPLLQNGEIEGFTSYKLPAISCVYHLDCYRVDAKDVLDLGWEEIINDKNNLILVEWPEKIESILPEKYIQVEFETLRENKRKIKLLKK